MVAIVLDCNGAPVASVPSMFSRAKSVSRNQGYPEGDNTE